MKFAPIDKESWEYFEQYDIFHMMDDTRFAEKMAIGAYLYNEAEGSDEPVGCMITTVQGQALILLWLYVDPDRRMQGLGGEMLDKLLELADQMGLKFLCAYFEDSPLRRTVCLGEEGYFLDRGFVQRQEMMGKWTFALRELIKLPMIQEIKPARQLISMARLSRLESHGFPFKIPEKLKEIAMASIAGDLDMVEKKISYVWLEGIARPRGVFILKKQHGIVSPILFMARDGDDAMTMIRTACQKAEKRYGQDLRVCITPHTREYLTLLRKLLPECEVGCHLLMAQTDRLKDRTKEEPDWEADAFSPSSLDEWDGLPENLPSQEIGNFEDLLVRGREDVTLTVGNLCNGFKLKSSSRPEEVKSLNEIPESMIWQAFADCSYYGYSGAFEKFPEHPDLEWFDPDLSCCIEENGRIRYLLLVHRREDGAYLPLLLTAIGAKGGKLLLLLIRYALVTARENCGDQTKVVLKDHDEKTATIIKKVTPKKGRS